mgnify:CR=1 FL=1
MLKKKFLYIFGILFFLLIIELLSLIFLHINKKFNRVYFKDADLEKTFIENSKNNLISFYFSKNYSQELGWDNNPDNTRLNSIGARNDFENQKKKKKYFTFGSSFTWGDGVDENETWQYYLSKEYDSYIANYGVGGYSAYQAYLKFKKKQNLSNRFEGVILTIFESEIDRIKNHYLNFYFESGIRIRPVPKIENNNLIHTPLPFFNKKKTFYKEYLDFIGKTYGIDIQSRQNRICELLDLCGLTIEKHKKLRMLSKGYRQRVGLAKALMSDPSVLILDEPTTGLDPNQIVEIRNVIKKIASEKTVILSTHIMREVEALCDKLVIIRKGKLVADDSLVHLQHKSSNQLSLSVQFDAPIDPDLFKSLKRITSLKVISDHQLVVTSDDERLRQEVLAIVTAHNLPLVTIKNVGASLEEIFRKLTTEEGEEES